MLVLELEGILEGSALTIVHRENKSVKIFSIFLGLNLGLGLKNYSNTFLGAFGEVDFLPLFLDGLRYKGMGHTDRIIQE